MRDARLRHRLTQEELAFGICSVSTLSKIENGSRKPHCSTFEALMQRMGEPLDMHIHYMGKAELERRRLIKSLEHEIRMRNKKHIRKILEEYDFISGKENLLDAQWRCLAEIALNLQVKTMGTEVYIKLMEVMRMTWPDFDGGRGFRGILYTHCEALIFQMLALCCQMLRRYEEADRILQDLLYYYRKVFEDTEEAEISVYYQLAELYLQMGQYSSSARFCERGLKKSLLQERYHFVSALLTQWACIMAKLGNTSESHRAAYHACLLNEIRTNENYLSKFL